MFIKVLTLALGASAIGLSISGCSVVGFVFPGTPKSTEKLQFEGFIYLPTDDGSWPISVMDYLTVEGRNLFVASIRPGSVYKVPLDFPGLPGPADVEVLTGGPAAHGVAFDPASHMGFVSRSGANMVDVFDPVTMKSVNHITVADDVDGIFFDPATALIYAASAAPQLATLIDPVGQVVVGTIPLAGEPEFAAIDAGARVLYQNLNDADALVVVELAKRAVTDRWPLDGCSAPTGIALDMPNRRLFVGCSGNARLAVVDIDTHAVLSTIELGERPDTVAYDPQFHRIYAAGGSGKLSTVQQVNADTYRLLGAIDLPIGAHTLAIDPISCRIYVAYATLIAHPRLAVFQALP